MVDQWDDRGNEINIESDGGGCSHLATSLPTKIQRKEKKQRVCPCKMLWKNRIFILDWLITIYVYWIISIWKKFFFFFHSSLIDWLLIPTYLIELVLLINSSFIIWRQNMIVSGSVPSSIWSNYENSEATRIQVLTFDHGRINTPALVLFLVRIFEMHLLFFLWKNGD